MVILLAFVMHSHGPAKKIVLLTIERLIHQVTWNPDQPVEHFLIRFQAVCIKGDETGAW
jgi:hypothetical protein